jgi:hypothetical protein
MRLSPDRMMIDGGEPIPTKKTSPWNWDEGQDELNKAAQNARDAAAATRKLLDELAREAKLEAEEAARKAAEEQAAREAASERRALRTSLVTPTPNTPTPPTPPTPPPPPIKTATPDIVLFDDSSVSIEMMTDLIFENIGGQELINIARNDTINGQRVVYQPIKNLSIMQQLYNPNNILSLQQTSEKYFQNFPIKLDEKIPTVGSGPNGSNVYIDDLTGDLVIELVNVLDGEQVESQISINGTIYEGNI